VPGRCPDTSFKDTDANCNVLVAVYEVLRAMVMKNSIFWDLTACSPLKVNRRFGLLCFLHAGFLLGLLLNPEDEGDMLILNVGCLSTDCTALYARR
jgi:hypothetical protein